MIAPMLFTGFLTALRFGISKSSRQAHLFIRASAGSGNLRTGFSALALVGIAGIALFSPSRAAESGSSSGQAEQSTSPGIAFSAHVEGRKLPDDIKSLLEDTMELGRSQGVPPASLGQLRRRAVDEADKLNDVLRSEAYYNGRVEPVIEEAKGGRFDLTYRVTLGPRTMIRSFRIVYADSPSDAASLPKDATVLGLQPNRSVRAQRVIDLTRGALTWLENHGHPKPKLDNREVIVDLAAHLAEVTLTITAGEPKRFGEIAVDNRTGDEGVGRTSADYVRSLAKFKPGDLYDRRKADATVTALRQTSLFDQVSLEVEDASGDLVTPQLTLGERARRSVGVGASWSSDEGAGVRGFWEHRNLFGGAEKLRLELGIAQTKQGAKAEFGKPHFLRDDQTLLGSFEAAHEDTDAYNENRVKLGAALARQLLPSLEASAGVSFEVYRTQDSTGDHNYRLFGLPLTIRYDGSDALLDPTEGVRLGGALTPYAGTANGSAAAFTKFEATGSTYWSFGKRPDLTLALRGRYGLMLAQETLDVPGSLRFYAGGGGSIRGYGYQLVGPLDAAKNPLGGRSVVETSAEARYRATQTIGIVAFLDAGNAYATATPKFNKTLQLGAGVGLRYYTPIGPVRADIGVPLNPRDGIDDPFQVYFSLGQAF
ncbi:MAG: BamA/TamA family outer membrane protein [Parvibaculum sp.]|uniref:autotransporter assembly complex protein TamA n=1 Tax=Parvibaculum sp. TaxID=2024848 RepID=UPI0025CED576|nr:BamA/TamA family outer membrane protein [Parvibaculum sp.]MCE9650926.1 BamA/TamA family outer membrane protein [Parvibaculum sp.]